MISVLINILSGLRGIIPKNPNKINKDWVFWQFTTEQELKELKVMLT